MALRREIEKTYNNQEGALAMRPTALRMCVATIWVAHDRAKRDVWKATTAAQMMRKMTSQLELSYPGCTKFSIWSNTMDNFNAHPHLLNKADILSMEQIKEILASCDSPTDQALFWLALLICSRIGNLKGYHVDYVGKDMVTITPVVHKAAGKTAQMTLELYYWNKEMRKSIRANLPTGFLDGGTTKALENHLTKLHVRWHSVRRTAIQTYIDVGTPLANIRAITLHKDDDTLLAYVGRLRPILDRSKPSGMATSHAPYIWKIQNILGKDTLRMGGTGDGASMPRK